MNWRDWVLTYAMGKYFLATGTTAFFVVLFYDFIVQRPFDLGFWQLLGLVVFAFQVWCGYELDRFTYDLRLSEGGH